jgi:uncharacterized protein (TIGR03083 family)
VNIREAIAAERRDLADLFGGLPGETWDAPTLCAGWRVREVVAHMTMPFRLSLAGFAGGMIRARGNFDRMADRTARRDAAAMSPAELVTMMRDNAAHPWKPPGGGYSGALTHDVVHGLDVTVALGLDRRVPEERLRPVLDGLRASRARRYFGVELTGVELRADDLDWSLGSGTVLSGRAQDLLLVVCGRRLPAGLLRGEPSDRFVRA